MAVVIGIPKSADPHETRTTLVGDVVKKLTGLGASIVVERGATQAAFVPDADLADVLWRESSAEVVEASDIVWTIGNLDPADEALLRPGQVLIGLLAPYSSADHAVALARQGVTAFAMELLPRISRAQSMDILSSQGAASGYQCVLIAAARAPKFFPMLTYAAGTIRPSRVLVIGAGVAGLQAIATAKRLGAIVEGYDVRPETREQIESLGAKFVDTGVDAAGTGGYARELTAEEQSRQAAALAKAIANADVLLTTAAVPGRKAPRIVTRDMIEAMRPGVIVVDMAAETGGNVEGTVAGKEMRIGPAHVVGPVNLPARMPVHTSEMFTDDVLRGTALTHGGVLTHAMVAKVLGLEATSISAVTAPVAPPAPSGGATVASPADTAH